MGVRIRNIAPSSKKATTHSLDSLLKKEIHLFGPGFGSKKKEALYTELSVLLTSGIRLKDALQLLAETQKKTKDRERLLELSKGLLEGKDLSELFKSDRDFTFYEQYAVSIGEQTGTLAQVIASLSAYYQRKNEHRRHIISALTYPSIVLATATLAVLFMLRFVVPMFQDIFQQNQVELPFITQWVVSLSHWVGSYGYYFLFTLLLILLSKRVYAQTAIYKKWSGKLLFRLPLIGPFIKLAHMARFTQAVSMLVSAKVSIPESVELAQKMISFYPLSKALKEAQVDLLHGKGLSQALQKHSIFDAKMIALIRVAEETNQTAFVFERLNEQYGSELLRRSKQFSTVLEPLIILIVGIIVATILIAMYLPMFELGNVLR